jgi:hypothetical protein
MSFQGGQIKENCEDIPVATLSNTALSKLTNDQRFKGSSKLQKTLQSLTVRK